MKLVIKATLFGIFTRYPDGAYLSFVCFNGPYDWVLCLRKDNDSGVPPFHVGENDASCNPCFRSSCQEFLQAPLVIQFLVTK